MDNVTLYRWWAVQCHTKDCDTTLLLCPIGPSQSGRVHKIYILKECAPFKETCPECKVEHMYSLVDVHDVDSDPPPSGVQPNAAFLKAIQPKKQGE